MDLLASIGNFFRNRIWGQTFPRIILFVLLGALGFYGIRSCMYAPPGPKERLYRIARDPAWAGLNMRGRESNMLGFSDALLDLIARREYFRIQFYTSPTSNLISGMQADNFDAILSNMVPDVYAKDRFIFSDPFYLLGPVLVVESASAANSIEDLAGKIIGIQRGSTLLIQGNIPKTIILVPYESMTIAIDDLLHDKIDGVVTDLFYAYALQEGFYHNKIKVVGGALTDEGLRVVAMKDDNMEPLMEAFDRGLKELKEDGTYYELLKNFQLLNINQ